PRAAQSLVLAAKARALLHGRLAATRGDVTALAAPVMRHRLLPSFAAEADQVPADEVAAARLREVPPPGTAAGRPGSRRWPGTGSRPRCAPACARWAWARGALPEGAALACTKAAVVARAWSSRSTAATSRATSCAGSTGSC